MEKAINAVKGGNGTTKIILAIAATLAVLITIGNIIYKQGLHEGQMLSMCKTVDEIKMELMKQTEKDEERKYEQIKRDEAQDAIAAEIQRKQAHQEGMFTAKMDNVEKTLVRIETYLLQWEAIDGEGS